MEIETGKKQISLYALFGIWSVSALTSLPGLAVSPILGRMSSIFPSASELDIQMLDSLPSLLIIPFVLLAGHLTERVGYMRLLVCGLWIFLISGILYLFCGSMWQLIAVSVLLGVGAGIIIPLSTSLVTRFFAGEYRTRQFGYCSAITNVTLVVATALAGYLADVWWRLPFVVYLSPIFSIMLMPFLSRADKEIEVTDKLPETGVSAISIDYKRLALYMLYYLLITYLTIIVSLNLPFLMKEYGYGSESSGIIISLFFLSIMLPGFFLPPLLRWLGKSVFIICLLMIATGLFMVYVYSNSIIVVAVGCAVAGIGYGIAQPYIYDCTAMVASPDRVTFALALVMAMNYVAILVAPFVIDFMQELLHVDSQRFAFGFNVVVSILAVIAILVRRIVVMYR